MPVEYLDGGESITAARLNLLFSECSRKMGLALDNKSFLVAGGVHADLTGKFFYFGNGPRPYTSGTELYDHSVFEDAAAAAVEESRDEALKILTYSSGGDLNDSLEAHSRNGYYLRADGASFPEKRYKFVPAEVVYEGIGFERVLWPRKYNKYNCFRFHNLNYYSMRVEFEGTDEAFTVEPLGCLCVRRDSVDSGYSAEYEYLWAARNDDPRFFVSMAPGGSAIAQFPYQHMLANNVSNPAIIYFWAAQFVQGVGSAKWHIDPHVYHDISSYYCPTYFPDPSDTTQPIGNFFHHKGEVEILGERKTFNGYQTISNDIPELGITTLLDETITITPTAAISQISTNLFCQWDASKPTALGGEAYTLDNTNTGRTNLRVYKTETGQVTVGALTMTIPFLSLVNITGDIAGLGEVTPSGRAFSFHRDTVDDVLKLNPWGNEDFDSTEQETNATSIEDRQLVLTPFGPRILFNHTYTFGGSFYNRDNSIDPTTNMYAEASGGQLTSPGYVQFDGYGWPIPGRDEDGNFFHVTHFQPAFFSPRVARAYSRIPGVHHPNILYPQEGPNGRDIDVSSVGDNYIETKYKFLAAITLTPSSETWQMWANPDTIQVGDMPRVPLLREHYNGMAQYLNSVRRITPLDYRHMVIVLPPTTGEDDFTILEAPEPNFGGVLGTAFCPREMFASFAKDSAAHKSFLLLGVPILTTDDLPDDYQDARETTATRRKQIVFVKDKITGGSGPPPSSEWTYQGIRTFAGTESQAIQQRRVNNSNWNAEFLWVSIDGVRQAVEARGWKFVYQHTFSLHELRLYDRAPSLVYPLPASRNFEFTRFVPSTTDPEAIIGQEFTATAGFEYDDKAAAFVDSATGEWKARQTSPAAIDTTPSGNLIPEAIAEPLPPNGSFDKFAVFFFTGLPPEILIADGRRNAAISHYTRHVLIQNHFTEDLDNGSAAFKIPVTWARHAADDVATPSYEAAIDMQNFASEHHQIPLMAQARNGSTESQSISQGDTIVSFENDKALEIVPMWKVYVDAEAVDGQE